MATNWYGKAVQSVLNKQTNLVSDNIKVALFTNSYVPNFDNDTSYTAISGETSGTGYTAGGLTLANKTLTQDSAANVWKFDADDITFSGVTLSFRYAVLYNATSNQLIACVDFGSTQSTANQDLTIRWESGTTTGILEITY